MNEVEFITSVKDVWMKAHRERERSALFIGCAYMPTDSTSVAVVDIVFMRVCPVSTFFLLLQGRKKMFLEGGADFK